MSALESMVGEMTVAELARFAGKSVDQVIQSIFSGPANGASSQRANSRSNTVAKPGTVPRGELRLDRVLSVVAAAGGPVDAASIREKVGGSAAQVRTVLKSLADAGKVRITGERRGTRYIAR